MLPSEEIAGNLFIPNEFGLVADCGNVVDIDPELSVFLHEPRTQNLPKVSL